MKLKYWISKVEYIFNKLSDIIITDIIYLIPSLLKWFYQRKIKKSIHSFPLKHLSGKTAMLFQHGTWQPKEKKQKGPLAVLLLHGDYAHPFIMLHLADMAKKIEIGPVFSLYISYSDTHFDAHRDLIKQAIDSIENIVKNNHSGEFNGVILAGHSMGAIEAAHKGFVEKDSRVTSVVSIAGRLKVVESIHSPCSETLKPSIHAIYREIQLDKKLPLYQIVAKEDWNVCLEATLIRDDRQCSHIIEDAMHLNIIFHEDLEKIFLKFLHQSNKENEEKIDKT